MRFILLAENHLFSAIQDAISPEVYFPAIAIASCVILFGLVLVYILRFGSGLNIPKETTSPEKFSEFFNKAEVGIGVIDAEGFVVLSNKSLHDLTGYSATQLTTIGFRSLFADREDYVEPSKVAGMLDRFGESLQVFLRHRNGSLIRVRFLVLPAPLAIRENAEVLLIETASAEGGGGGQEVTDIGDSLQVAKDTFLASLNNDLKTPLTVMLASASMLADEKTYSPELVSAILESGQRLLNELDGLLILANNDAAERADSVESFEFNLRPWILETIETYRSQASTKNISIDVSGISESVVPIPNHITFLRLINLILDFSIDSMPAGKVAIGVDHVGSELSFSVRSTIDDVDDHRLSMLRTDNRLDIARKLAMKLSADMSVECIGDSEIDISITLATESWRITGVPPSLGKAA